eukprot:scaffold10652_cov127-Skeletonema_marinoi.AAC.3
MAIMLIVSLTSKKVPAFSSARMSSSNSTASPTPRSDVAATLEARKNDAVETMNVVALRSCILLSDEC